ncbi:probable NAD(P)H dehydrogenase subunit CRR3, chloroplastic [Argentina anserina]|uniref:probable NAD(P)H dehydrogenase subunit CRR3, chloroplastic n=1 Tax=Argentina anserina TaxID=57926 RepID=UPI0021768FF9|nr:probable NAD(P)H dehydrogenase subunit CRR3, chloroplastic [Potentilla anserina]
MSSLSSRLSLTKNLARASLPNNINGSSSPPSLPANNKTSKLPMRSRTTPPLPGKKQQQQNLQRRKPKQPSVIELESAIGAGRFRDTDNSDVEEGNDAKFDMLMMNFNKLEGPVEKQLRETGEWVTNQTERGFRSNGKKILKFMFLWTLPIWAFSLLVAAGAIKLNIPLLNDLIM